MNLIMERGKKDKFPSVYAFNTFFYPKLISSGHASLKRWTKKVTKKIDNLTETMPLKMLGICKYYA